MDIPIPEFSRQQIPRFPHEKEIRSIDPALFKPVAPTLLPLLPILKTILRQTAPKEPEIVTAPASKPPGSLLSTEEAAAFLGISQESLRRLCRRKAVTFIRVTPDEYRFHPDDRSSNDRNNVKKVLKDFDDLCKMLETSTLDLMPHGFESR
jgi:hypothetical protein